MSFELRNCPACGSSELKFIDETSFKCMSCGNTFKEKEESVDLETKINKLLNEQEHKLYSNAKVNLWKETHKEYLSDENIKKWIDEIKKYSPEDFFANFYDIVTFSDVDTICDYLINYLKNNNYIFVDEVIRYLIKTADDGRLIQPIIAILEQSNLDTNLYEKYQSELNELSYKLDEGVFNTILPRDIFICYSSKDIKEVTELVNYLEYNELSCFVAQRNLRHGKGAKENYIEELKKAMHNSKCIVFVSSENSRTMNCDALKIEIPYLKDHEPEKGRIEYVLDKNNYVNTKPIVKMLLKSYFEGKEFCTDKEDLIERIAKILTTKKEDDFSLLKKQFEEQQKLINKLLEQQAKKELEEELNDNSNSDEDKEDVDFNFKKVLASAKNGDAEAQYKIGHAYYSGEGVEQNYAEAFKYYKLSADQGYKCGQNGLGVCYKTGNGVEKNLEKAIKYYKLSADQGFDKAQCNLAHCYKNGEGVEQNYKEAFKYYKLSAEQGYDIAQFFLGICYESGIGVDKNLQLAFKYYKLSADQGFDRAQCNLGNCYELGKGTVKNQIAANRWYKLSADQGHAIAQNNYANDLFYGKGMKQDYAEAVKYYKLSAGQGYASAQFSLGYCYEFGDGTAKNLQEAYKYYKLAADQGYARAQFNLGLCYEFEKGVAKNMQEAYKYYKLAAAQGHEKAKDKVEKLAKILNK